MDISPYVWMTLTQVQLEPKEKEELHREIASRTDGIFLWASLVTKVVMNSVRKRYGLKNSSRQLSKFQKIFNNFITNLSSLLRRSQNCLFL